MRAGRGGGGRATKLVITDSSSISSNRMSKFDNTLHSDPNMLITTSEDQHDYIVRNSSASSAFSPYSSNPNRLSCEGSPMTMSPWNHTSESPWSQFDENFPRNALVGSLVREEGHIYSLAASKDLLYTGSDSKNIRVWKNLEEYSAFKSSSGLVKAIMISGEKIFTGHQDGKIRIWKVSPKNPTVHKRSGTLPTLKDIFRYSIKPSNYVRARHRSALWIKHSDAISCLSLNEDWTFLYSASWDRTFKVWRVSDSKCIESVKAHEDAVNSVVACDKGLVFTGSADGTVKAWKRQQQQPKTTKHTLVQTLLKQDCAVTALAVSAIIVSSNSIVYGGSSDGAVNYWENGMPFSHGGVLIGHKLAVLCLATAGSLVFSGSADKTICIWRKEEELTSHTWMSVLTGHGGPVKCLAVEEDRGPSKYGDQRWVIYSGSLDKSVKVWSVSEMAVDDNHTAMMQQQQQQQHIYGP